MRKQISLLLIVSILIAGCASGPEVSSAKVDAVLPPDSTGIAFSIVEYKSSDVGLPVPEWIGRTASQLEPLPEFQDYYLFAFTGTALTYESTSQIIREFPSVSETTDRIVDRIMAKCEGVAPLPGELLRDCIRIVEITEYVGLRLHENFWAYESRNFEDAKAEPEFRYRYWILYSIPREQVDAGLRFAYQSTAPKYPARIEEEMRALDLLIDRFRDGL